MERSEHYGIKEMVAVFLVTLVIVKLVTMVKKKRYNLPPGPWGLPLVGYLPFFGPQPHVTFMKLRKKYGDVISISMGSWPAVVISGSDAIKEALVTRKDDFAGRPAFTSAQLIGDRYGYTLLSHLPILKVHRKIVSNVLHTYSKARTHPIENIIRSDAEIIINEFLSHGSKAFCPLDPLDLAAYSMIYQLVYDRHKNVRDDKDFMAMLKNMRDFSNFSSAGNPVDVIPWLRYIMPSKVTYFLDMLHINKKVRDKKVEEHESSFDENNLRDITDGLIHNGNCLTEEEKALGIDKGQVVGNLSSIFGAGSDTVSSTLKWCVALMAAYPEVQEEVFQQIDTVVGQNRDITLADRAQLPLVEATVYEVFRYVGVVPFAIPHAATRDTTVQGYDIPKGTVVMVNLYSVLMDDKLWGDPRVFRPQRFLDSEGQLDRALMEQAPVFSLGRRRCVGEFLGKMELFLFFATLVQRVKFFKPPGKSDWELKAVISLSIIPEPFDVCVSQR